MLAYLLTRIGRSSFNSICALGIWRREGGVKSPILASYLGMDSFPVQCQDWPPRSAPETYVFFHRQTWGHGTAKGIYHKNLDRRAGPSDYVGMPCPNADRPTVSIRRGGGPARLAGFVDGHEEPLLFRTNGIDSNMDISRGQ